MILSTKIYKMQKYYLKSKKVILIHKIFIAIQNIFDYKMQKYLYIACITTLKPQKYIVVV